MNDVSGVGALHGVGVAGGAGKACGVAAPRVACATGVEGATSDDVERLRRVGPGFSGAGDDSWRDDGFDKAEDEFFQSPALGRAILVAVLFVMVLCAYMVVSGRA